MKRLTNIMQKQLFLTIMMLLCVATYGQTDYLPKAYFVRSIMSYEYPEDSGPILMEEFKSGENHRVVAIYLQHGLFLQTNEHKQCVDFSMKFGERYVQALLTEYNYHVLSLLVSLPQIFKCYDANIPIIELSCGTSKKHLDTFRPKVGFNKLIDCGEIYNLGNKYVYQTFDTSSKIIVLPLLKSVKPAFYTSYYCTESISVATKDEKVWVSAAGDDGTKIAAFACTRGGDEMIELPMENVPGGDSWGFNARLVSSNRAIENQDIYIFSYVENNGTKYYSSNYQKLTLDVYQKPKWSFVNAKIGQSNYLYVPKGTNSIEIKNINSCDLRVSIKDEKNRYNVVRNGDNGSWPKNSTIKINNPGHNKKLSLCFENCIGNHRNDDAGQYTAGKAEITYTIDEVPNLDFHDVTVEYNCNNTATVTIGNKWDDWKYPYNGYKLFIKKNNGTSEEYLRSDIVFSNLAPGTKLVLTRKYDWIPNSEITKTITIEERYGSNYYINVDANGFTGCTAANDAKIIVNVQGGSENYDFYVDGKKKETQSGRKYEYKPTSIGSYIVKVIDTYNCSTKEITVPIGIKKDTEFKYVSDPTSKNFTGCTTANDASITVKVQGGTKNYTYKYTHTKNGKTGTKTTDLDNHTFSELKDVGTGRYSIVVTDGKNCSTEAKTVDVGIEAGTEFEYASDPEYKNFTGCTTANDASIKVSVKGGTKNYTYKYTNTANGKPGTITVGSDNYTFGGLKDVGTGSYSITVTDGKGCTTKEKTVPIEIETGTEFEYVSDPEYKNFTGCTAAKDASITIKVQGGSGTYNYFIGDQNKKSNTSDKTYVFSPTNATSYKVKVTDSNGCSTDEKTVPVGIEKPFNFEIVQPTKTNGYDIACNGGTYTLTLNISDGTPDDNGKYYLNNNPITPKYETAKNAGPHSFTISDIKGCSLTRNITLTQPDPITINEQITKTKADCEQAKNGEVEVAASGGTGTLTYHLYNINDGTLNSNNGKFTGLGVKTYTLSVTDANGCPSEERTVTVGSNNYLSLSVTDDDIVPVKCHGESTGSITLNPKFTKPGFSGGFKYWLNGEKMASNKFEGLAVAKDYKVKVQPEGSDCFVEMDNVEVKGPATDELKYTVTPVNFTTTTSSDARIDVTPSGGWGGHTVIVKDNNGAVVSDNTDLRPGTYTVTVTDVKGCIANDNKEYTIARPNTDLGLNVVEHINVKCYGESTGKIKVIASGGWGNYSYTLSPNNGSIRDSANYKIFENLPKDTYKVTVADKMDVVKTATIIIEQPDAALSASSKIDSVKCNGGNDGKITVTVTGGTHGTRGYTLSLDGNTYYDESGKIEITGKKEGVYKYTVVDANECVSPEYTVKIDEPTAIVLSAAAAGELHNGFNIPCAGGTGEIVVSAKGGTAGYQFSIDSGNLTAQYGKDAKHTFSGVKAGKYNITVKDGHGCSTPEPAEIELTQPEPFFITNIDLVQPKCNGGNDGKITIVAKGGVPNQNDAYNFSIDGNSASEKEQHTFTDLAAKDNYHIVVTDANNCSTDTNIVINEPELLTAFVNAVQHNKCFGEKKGIITFAVNGGTAPYGYVLNDADKVTFSSDMTITGLPAKNKHFIVVSDANGCKVETIEQAITEPTDITTELILNDYNDYNIRCFGGTDNAEIRVSGGVGNYMTTIDTTTIRGEKVLLNNLKAKKYEYVVEDGNNCKAIFQFDMKQPDSLRFEYFKYTNAKCYNKSDGTLSARIKGGVKNYIFGVTDSTNAEIDKKETNADIYTYSNYVAGNYMLSVSDANNCMISQNFTIQQPEQITISLNKLKDVVCKGTSSGEVYAEVHGGTSPYSYLWNNAKTGASIKNLSAGNYSVVVTDANGCETNADANGAKVQVAIEEPEEPLSVSEIVGTNPTCSYNDDGTITILVSGGWGNYSFDINGVHYGDTNTITGLTEGTYTAMITDANGCQIMGGSVGLKKPDALAFETEIGTIICYGGTTDVSITEAAGGTGANYYYSIDNAQTWQPDSIFTGVQSGIYTLTMKDENGCTLSKIDTINQPAKLILKDDVRHNYNSNMHQANGKIAIMPEGGIAPYSYQWNDTTITDSVLNNIGFGLYTVIVTDNLGCVESNTYYINDNNPSPEIVNAVCPEGTDGSISFADSIVCTKVEWYNARTEELLTQSNSLSIIGLPKGIYKAKLFNDEQISYIYAEITAPDSLNYVAKQTDIECHGYNSGSAEVEISGGVEPISVVWKNQSDADIAFNPIADNLIAGHYTAYISDAANCQSSAKEHDFNIIEPTEAFILTENVHNDVKCNGNNDGVVSFHVAGNQGQVSYFQNDTALPTNIAEALYAGNYTFYAVDQKNCKTHLNVTISQPEAIKPVPRAIMPIKCASETGSVIVDAEGGVLPYTYKLLGDSEFGGSPIFDNLASDNYGFVVKDNNNCYDTAYYTLTEPAQLAIVNSQLKDEYCGHNDGSIEIEVEGGTGEYEIEWSAYQTGKSANNLSAGSYRVVVSDDNNCQTTDTFVVVNIPAPSISIKNIDSTRCFGSADGSAELNISFGTGKITYWWATDTTETSYSNKLKAGEQEVIAIDELGCADTAQFAISQPDSAEIAVLVENPLCYNDNSGKLTASVSNYKTDFDFKWSNGIHGNTITDLYAGKYNVSVTNAKGCIATKTAELINPKKIEIQNINITNTKCNEPNGKIELVIMGGTGNLQFKIDDKQQIVSTFENVQTGTHKLMVIDENQCDIDTTIFVGTNEPPKLVINSLEDVKCYNEANGKVSVGVVGGMEPFVYSWNNGNSTTTSTKSGFEVGDYKVRVFDAFGCSDSLTFTIAEPYKMEIYEQNAINPTCYGYSDGQISAGVIGGTMPYTYKWGDKQNTAKATKLAAGSHYLNVTDKNGCKAKKYFTLNNPQPVVVDIPEVISICSNQTADIDAGHEGSFHYWSSTNGFESVAQAICVNTQGEYTAMVTTPEGCTATATTLVNVSEKEINSNFLLQSDAYVGDTIVMIEISWPLPESIEWSCPDGMTIISDAGDEIEMVAEKEGIYDVGLTTYNDICTEQTFKSIVVNPRAQKPKEQKLMAKKLVKSVNVYPNPTTGPFNLEIELNEESDVTIEIVHISGKIQSIRRMKGDRQYILNFSNSELNAGINTITITAGNERITKKIVIIN